MGCSSHRLEEPSLSGAVPLAGLLCSMGDQRAGLLCPSHCLSPQPPPVHSAHFPGIPVRPSHEHLGLTPRQLMSPHPQALPSIALVPTLSSRMSASPGEQVDTADPPPTTAPPLTSQHKLQPPGGHWCPAKHPWWRLARLLRGWCSRPLHLGWQLMQGAHGCLSQVPVLWCSGRLTSCW